MFHPMKCTYGAIDETLCDMAKIINKSKYPNNLRKLREAAGLTQADIGRIWGVERGDVSRIENGDVGIAPHKLRMLAKAFGWTASQILDDITQQMVMVVGRVGAGAKVQYMDDHAKGSGLDRVDPPQHLKGEKLVALRVEGDSMLPMLEDGWLVFYKRLCDGVPHDCVGRLCIIRLPDETTVVKKMRQGSAPDLFHLLSHNAEPMIDQEVVWAARVLDIRPS